MSWKKNILRFIAVLLLFLVAMLIRNDEPGVMGVNGGTGSREAFLSERD